MPTFLKDIKAKILRERGLTTTKQAHRHKRMEPVQQIVVDPRKKTTHMKYLEQKYRQPIENVLVSGSLSEIAKQLGNEVDVSTISKWKARLGLRYGPENLPDCTKCNSFNLACEAGVCKVLAEAGLWDLVDIKKQELKGGK